MKSSRMKKILAVILCLTLGLSTNMMTMAESTNSPAVQSVQEEQQTGETVTTDGVEVLAETDQTVTGTPTPTATPEPTPTPEVTATPTPEATPEATATPTPETTPEATATPTPETTPEATPEVTATPTPEATPTEVPETQESTQAPEVTVTPTSTPIMEEGAIDQSLSDSADDTAKTESNGLGESNALASNALTSLENRINQIWNKLNLNDYDSADYALEQYNNLSVDGKKEVRELIEGMTSMKNELSENDKYQFENGYRYSTSRWRYNTLEELLKKTGLIDLNLLDITAEKYNTMLKNVESTVESPTYQFEDNKNNIYTNVPITWTTSRTEENQRGTNYVQIEKSSGNWNWNWDAVKGLDADAETDPAKVWDGSRLNTDGTVDHYYTANNYLQENMISALGQTLYDSATWKQEAGNTFYRFQGTFTLNEEDIVNNALTLSSVAGYDRIYLNDDIFVFVYPTVLKGQITNDNFMNYFAFWSGTSAQNSGITFRGNAPSEILTTDKDDIEGLNRVTNGWSMKVFDDNLGDSITNGYEELLEQNLIGSGENISFTIDVFANDYNAGGGMYRLILGKQPGQKTNVWFDKVNSVTGKAIEGATFTLKGDNGKEYTATSDANGRVEFTGVLQGTYTMTESALEGYEPTGETWTVTVTANSQGSASFTITGGGSHLSGDAQNGYKISNTPKDLSAEIEADKWVTTTEADYNNREYTIHLAASSSSMTPGQEAQNASIVLVLDRSGSMSGSMGDLKNAVYTFLNTAYAQSPNSEIAIVSFANNANSNGGFYTLNQEYESWGGSKITGKDRLEQIVWMLTSSGGTYLNKAMTEVNDLLDTAKTENAKYVITFTDGAPGGNGEGGDVAVEAFETAKQIKTRATHYTIAFGNATSDEFSWDDPEDYSDRRVSIDCTEYLERLATDASKAYEAKDAENLKDIFEDLAGEVSRPKPVQADKIVDVIDARFELAAGEADILRTTYGDNIKIEENADGTTTITWTGDAANINPKDGNNPGWSVQFKIKAKDDFIGGNMIPTNGAGSGIFKEGSGNLEFEKPTVNVKLLALSLESKEQIVFKGDYITPMDLRNVSGSFAEQLRATLKFAGESGSSVPGLGGVAWEESTNQYTATISYKYPGTDDEIGVFTFTFKAVDGKGNFTNHPVTEGPGQNVEQYQLTVDYSSKKLDERKNMLADAGYVDPVGEELKDDVNGECPIIVRAEGLYNIHSVVGQINITKKITGVHNFDTQGDPIFTFRIAKENDGTSEKPVWYRTIRFNEQSESGEGKLTTLEGLTAGTYKISELKTQGYNLDNVEVSSTSNGNGVLVSEGTNETDPITVTFSLPKTYPTNGVLLAEITITNGAAEGTITDTDVIVNRFTWNGEEYGYISDDLPSSGEVGNKES